MPFDDRLTNGQTPARLYALCKLILLKRLEKEELREYLQPKSLTSQNAFSEVYTLADRGDLITEGYDKKIVLNLLPKELESTKTFRMAIAQRTFSNPELTFCKFSSWYLLRGAPIFKETPKDLFRLFDEEVNTSKNLNIYNDTNINGWRTWASFLGLGFIHNGIMIPNVHVRLADILEKDKEIVRGMNIPFRQFMEWLNQHCPELDFGEIAKNNIGKAQINTQSLSIGLSAGLRTLHDTGKIKLIYTSDTRDTWFLTKANTHDIHEQISEISIGGR